MLSLSCIIPTKNRPRELARLCKSIEKQSRLPGQIIIVDCSDEPIEKFLRSETTLPFLYQHVDFQHLTRQKNIGLKLVREGTDLVLFLDDDIVLCDDSLRAMLESWVVFPGSVGGCGFNIIGTKPSRGVFLKSLFLADAKGKGRVLKSGFTSYYYPAEKDSVTQWLCGGATVWRREIFDEFTFDEWFGDYGFAEDLDFSYRVGKRYTLLVASRAKARHSTDEVTGGRNNFLIGKMQAVNRLYFVRKNPELSVFLCYYAIMGEVVLNVLRGIFLREKEYFKRARGNIAGLAHAFIPGRDANPLAAVSGRELRSNSSGSLRLPRRSRGLE